MAPDYSDIELLNDFSSGKENAFKHIHALFFGRLFAFSMSLIDTRQESEEIVSDSLFKLFQKNKDFDSLANIKAFLYVATRNSCLDHLRSRQRKLSLKYELTELVASDAYLEIAQIEGEMLQAIYTAVKALPNRCKTIMEMLYVEGLAAETISNKLHISIQTVYSQKRRAVSLLKAALDKKFITISLLLLIRILYFL